MERKYLPILIALVVCLMAFASCKKENAPEPQVVELTAQDNGKTITIAAGQTIKVILENPGDGGYNFDTPKYNSSALTLISHTHTDPANVGVIGAFGTDSWEFSGLGDGQSAITITASRTAQTGSNDVMFTGNVVVR